MKLILALLAIASSVYAQTTASATCGVFTECIAAMERYKTSTCDSFLRTNASMVPLCLCYYQANRLLCYNNCQNPTPDQAGERQIADSVALQACTGFNVNYKAPGVAPWVSVSSANTAPAGTAPAGTPSAPNTAQPATDAKKSDAYSAVQSLFVLAAAFVPALF
jgi:hypothetical protein